MRKIFTALKTPLLAFSIMLVAIFSHSVFAQSAIHSRWATHDDTSTKTIDHQAMTNILTFIAVPQDPTKYNLKGLDPRVSKYIADYRDDLQNIQISEFNKNEQLAYWLNLYNVAVIEKVSSNVDKSGKLRKLRGKPGDAGQWWSQKNIEVEGVLLSLEDIEQEVLARHFDQPLFIYGLFYGVNGDGFSTSVAFTGDNVTRQLQTMAKAFINDKDNIKIKRGEVKVSSLLAWNKAIVFHNSDEEILAHLRTYATGKTASELANVYEVSTKHKFNWKSAVYSPRPVNRSSFGAASAGSFGGGGGGYRGGS